MSRSPKHYHYPPTQNYTEKNVSEMFFLSYNITRLKYMLIIRLEIGVDIDISRYWTHNFKTTFYLKKDRNTWSLKLILME